MSGSLQRLTTVNLVIVALVLAFVLMSAQYLTGTYEETVLFFSPSAERAVKYGDRHFESSRPLLYDIALAEKMYNRAVALDTNHLYVHHQLARIAFLRGDFFAALEHIHTQIATHGDAFPKAYYVRALIEGYMGEYAAAKHDYERFLLHAPDSWAGYNDYSWVLLKANRPHEAVFAAEIGLEKAPDNVWLLNSAAIARYEIGDYEKALEYAERASAAYRTLNERDWLEAYPGNDPAVAEEGMLTLRASIDSNMHTIRTALADFAVE